MNATERVRLTAKLPVEIEKQIEQDVRSGRVANKIAWIEEAAREKLDRDRRGECAQDGILSGLGEGDVKLVRKLAECLRHQSKSRGFRRAVEANLSWLVESVSPKPRR